MGRAAFRAPGCPYRQSDPYQRLVSAGQGLVTIREQRSLIYSMYGQYIRFGYINSLTEFLSRPPDPMAGTAILNYGFYDFTQLA